MFGFSWTMLSLIVIIAAPRNPQRQIKAGIAVGNRGKAVQIDYNGAINPANLMIIQWWEYSENGVTDGRMDRRTERQTNRKFIKLFGRN